MSLLTQTLLSAGIAEQTAAEFDLYYHLLTEWNEKINLTAITEESEVATKHFLDCLAATKSGKIQSGMKLIDIGTGAGFPGLPLKIADKSLNITLLDSLNKRVNFLNTVIEALHLNGITAVHARAEELGKNPAYREQYDICISRAVANLATLTELCLPFVRCGGYFISLKGPKGEEELAQAQKAISLLGGKFESIVRYTIPGTDLSHNMILIQKISQTPTRFPRNAPKPSKEPLI